MSSSYLMILFGIILSWNEVMITTGQPLGMEDYYNLIEPKEDNNNFWIKPRGKVNMKNLILSINKIEAKQKQYWNMNDIKTKTNLKTTPEIISEPTTTENIVTIPTVATTTIYYDNPPRIPSLHEQKETDQKRFYHSLLDGWVY